VPSPWLETGATVSLVPVLGLRGGRGAAGQNSDRAASRAYRASWGLVTRTSGFPLSLPVLLVVEARKPP
jgi:hypothetical protein